MNIGKIAAIVVTYNRAKLLDKVLAGLTLQSRKLDCVIIVNNASNDNTLEVIDKYKNSNTLNIQTETLSINTGGAGGFYHGVKVAYELGYDGFWLMDDDTVPESEALEYLENDLVLFEQEYTYKPAFVCSTVLWHNDDLCEMNIPSPIWDWPRFLYKNVNVALVGSCSFVSVLITREKVRLAGYPIKDFFIWYDDVEYTKRLTNYGYPGILSIKSKVHHLLGENKGVNYTMITNENSWKYLYGMRNEVSVLKRNEGILKASYVGFCNIKSAFSANISIRTKLKLIKSFLKGFLFKTDIEFPER